ncbi:MAG: hypothetical protein KDA75_04410 [Planctomycetaceae bacterium]|nr:hypothetical protein [Planctomycetaceae bacterium]
MKRTLLLLALLAGSIVAPAATRPVAACPMCKNANESDQDGERNTKPQAYMYSILFMISMPATLLGAFSFAFWRLQKGASVANSEQSVDQGL